MPHARVSADAPGSCLRPIASCDGTSDYTYSAVWSPVDDYVLSGSIAQLRLLQVERAAGTIERVATFDGQSKAVFVKWSRDGRFALSVSTDVRLLAIHRDPPAIEELANFTGHHADIYFVAWSPDGRYALTGGKDSTLRLLEVDAERALLEQRAVFIGHAGKVHGVAWSPDGRYAFSVGEDGTGRLIAVDTRAGSMRQLARIKNINEETAVSWPDANLVVTGTWGVRNTVQQWSLDAERGAIRAERDLSDHPSGLQVVEWSHAGQHLVTGGHGDSIRLFNRRDGALESIASLDDHTGGVHAVSWSPDDAYMVLTSSRGDHVTLLDARSCVSPPR